MDRQGDKFSLIETEHQSYVLWNTYKGNSRDWDSSLLTELMHEVYGDVDISDIMLAHDDSVRLIVGDECYILVFTLLNDKTDFPIIKKVPDLVFNEFLEVHDSRARELTSIGESDSSSFALVADKTKYNWDLDQIFFRLKAVSNSYARISATTLCVFRPLRPVPELKDLNVHPLTYELFNIKDRLVVFSGPTASGKSTSICSGLLAQAKKFHKMFYSVENPIEYDLQHAKGMKGVVKQFDLDRDFKGSYEKAFSDFLRMHVRNVYASEVRLSEEVRAVIQAQRSNMQVFTTTHAPRAWDVPTRLVGEIPLEIRLLELLDLLFYFGGISSQRLVKLKSKYILLQDIVIFNDEDRIKLVAYAQSTLNNEDDSGTFADYMKALILDNVSAGRAITQLGHLDYHLDKGVITAEEYRSTKEKLDLMV